jgi:predicted lipoprotein with Yx(FWY)xxD motif
VLNAVSASAPVAADTTPLHPNRRKAPTTATAVPPPLGAVAISSGGSGSVGAGRVLVDGDGFSLYDFTGDGFEALTGCQLASNVSPTGASCTSVWMPVLATGPLHVRLRSRGRLAVQHEQRQQLHRPAGVGVWETLGPSGVPVTGPITVTTETVGGSTILAAVGNPFPGGAATATLYSFNNDSATSSACNGACANAWPPLLTSETPTAGPGVDASKLGTIQRADGSFQITYAGHPLYMFSHALNATTNRDGIMAFGGQLHSVPA